MSSVLQFDKKTYAKYKIADFALIAALFVPGADTEGVKFVHNWMSWVCSLRPDRCVVSQHCLSPY